MSRFREEHHKRILPINATDFQQIEENLKRKWAIESNRQIIPPLEEPIRGEGDGGFEAEPNPGVVVNPITAGSNIFIDGMSLSGSTTNIGAFRAGAGVEGSDSYRVDANNQGLFTTGVYKNINPIAGSMSVWLKPHDSEGFGTNNYIFDVGDHLVLRYESGSSEIRFYPSFTSSSGNYVAVEAPDWWTSDWKKVSINWDYPEQEFKLKWGDEDGAFNNSGTVQYPPIDEFSLISTFADLNNENNVFHDVNFLMMGSIGVAPIDKSNNCLSCCYKIDATSGVNSTYGQLGGLDDGNINGKTSLGFSENHLRLWRNSIEQTRDVDFTEVTPIDGTFTVTPVPFDGESFITAIVPFGEKCPEHKFIIAVTSGSGTTAISPSIYPQISGSVGSATVFKMPFPYVEGTLLLEWQGATLNQGSDSDWTELEPWSGTVQINEVLPVNSTITAKFIPETRFNESTNNSLSGSIDGSNVTFGTSYNFDIKNFEVKLNGQEITNGVDYNITSNRTFDMTDAPSSNEILSTNYDILFWARVGSTIAREFDDSNDGDSLTTDMLTVRFDATSGTIGVTLPDAYRALGHVYNLTKIDSTSNQLDFSGSGSDLINGQPTQTIFRQYTSVRFESFGTGWMAE